METIGHIAQVALRLFEQKGFEAVTMEDVAKAASVSRRTLFRHFPSKADLVWAGTDEVLGVLKSVAVAPAELASSLHRRYASGSVLRSRSR